MALIECKHCGKTVSDKARVCPHCGGALLEVIQSPLQATYREYEHEEEKPINNVEDTNSVQPEKKKIYMKIVIGIILIIIAVMLVTTYKFGNYASSLGYYKSQYENCVGSSSVYGGWVGREYYTIASEWKKMYYEAVLYLSVHSILALLLSIVGGKKILNGIKRLRGDSNSGID